MFANHKNENKERLQILVIKAMMVMLRKQWPNVHSKMIDPNNTDIHENLQIHSDAGLWMHSSQDLYCLHKYSSGLIPKLRTHGCLIYHLNIHNTYKIYCFKQVVSPHSISLYFLDLYEQQVCLFRMIMRAIHSCLQLHSSQYTSQKDIITPNIGGTIETSASHIVGIPIH